MMWLSIIPLNAVRFLKRKEKIMGDKGGRKNKEKQNRQSNKAKDAKKAAHEKKHAKAG